MENRSAEFIKWSNTFACGIKMIDDQHMGLIDMVNDMFSHVSDNDEEEREYFSKVVNHLLKYVSKHFSDEERILNATRFPGFDEHKMQHEMFTANVGKIFKEYRTGNKQNLYTVAKYLKEWILSHIAIMDKQYFEYFRKIATRKEDGRLSITKNDVLQIK